MQAQQQAEQAQQQAEQVQQAIVNVKQAQQAEQAKPAAQATAQAPAPAPVEQKTNKDSSSGFFSARVSLVLCAASQKSPLSRHIAVAVVTLFALVTSSLSCHSACLFSLQLKTFSMSV